MKEKDRENETWEENRDYWNSESSEKEPKGKKPPKKKESFEVTKLFERIYREANEISLKDYLSMTSLPPNVGDGATRYQRGDDEDYEGYDSEGWENLARSEAKAEYNAELDEECGDLPYNDEDEVKEALENGEIDELEAAQILRDYFYFEDTDEAIEYLNDGRPSVISQEKSQQKAWAAKGLDDDSIGDGKQFDDDYVDPDDPEENEINFSEEYLDDIEDEVEDDDWEHWN